MVSDERDWSGSTVMDWGVDSGWIGEWILGEKILQWTTLQTRFTCAYLVLMDAEVVMVCGV